MRGVVDDADLVDRAARLFRFLARVQGVGVTRVQDAADLGVIEWLGAIPDHPSVRFTPNNADAPFLLLDKVRRTPAVDAPEVAVRAWLAPGRLDDPDDEPSLLQRRLDGTGTRTLLLSDHPNVVEEFDAWLARWREWAAGARIEEAALRLYRAVYQMYSDVNASAESKEAVLALGCLVWRRPGWGTARRHVLTLPVKLDFDTDSGRLTVRVDRDGGRAAVELSDFLDPSEIADPGLLRTAERELVDEGLEPFDRATIAGLMRRLLHSLGPSSSYRDEDVPATATDEPVGFYAPALIMRSRGKRGLTRVLDSISDRIQDQREVPSGIRNLVDPAYAPTMVRSEESGAIVRDGDDCFLPLPLNSVQLQILEHVDSHAHTIVQGPPGTGKTHTAAALITHLLAQGKRVLVTAHTDRALEEVRGKLREEMRGLCVSVAGASRDNFDDLKRAMERIAQEADRHNPHRAQTTVKAAQARVADLRAERADIRKQLLRLREVEVVQHQCGRYRGTLTELVTRHRDEASRFDWISALDPVEPGAALPVSAADVAQWRSLLLDSALDDPESRAPDLITTHDVPPVDQIALWSERLLQAEARVRSCSEQGAPQWTERIAALNPPTRADLLAMVRRLDRELGDLAASRDAWVREALADISLGRAALWQDRAMRLAGLTQPAQQLVAQVGISQVRVNGGDTAALVSLAEAVRAHIETAGPLKVGADGMPKAGFAFGKSRVLKDAAPLFEHVRVDGRIPTTAEQLDVFLRFEEIERLLGQLDEVWVGTPAMPVTGSPTIRLTWHREHAEQLRRLLSCGAELAEAGRQLRTFGLPEPDWADANARKPIFASFEAVTAIDERRAVQHLFDTVSVKLNAVRFQPHATANLQELHAAIERGDVEAYRRAYQRLGELNTVRRRFVHRHELGARMASLPRLRDAIAATASDPAWDNRLVELENAWEWAGLGRWLAAHEDDTVNELFGRLDDIEASLRNEASELAVTKAWDYAVGPERLTANTRVDLRQYAQLVRRLGKGTGAHADRRRAEIRETLARCRSAVPVWIMPIYRVVEQLDIEQDMFDVVVVDEASQAGVEAVFLQYLAPRIVVIGDNRQVSPSGVGVKIDTVNGLGEQFLADNLHRATWTDPKRSLFDEAAMRFPSRLTLLEHRRCVPEIIGFSNKIAYEKDDVRLVPVRLYGVDRLPPIRTEYVPDGVSTPGNVNEIEADRIVARILECLADSRYDGKTFGVISLLGTAQAEVIWKKMLVKVSPEEIDRRRLRCGDAADFQGAERDVMFLSMVKSAGPETRLVARADESATQRYNVAVSRAADQLWLFHSVTAEQLKNPADLRYQLLDYCRSIETTPPEITTGVSEPVPENRPVAPFRSLFEQCVFNRIVGRGYRVVAQYDVGGHALDMVIVGGHIRVAVQCDGDRWAGPIEYQRSMAWQRDLQRCGWPFFRIRQSRFVSDPESSLEPLWQLLDEVGLTPVSAEDLVQADAAPIASATSVGTAEPVIQQPVVDPLADFDWRKPEPDTGAGENEQVCPVEENVDIDVPIEPPNAAPAPSVVTEEAGEQEYSAFNGLVSPLSAASPIETVVSDLLRVVKVEGPVTAGRLRSVFFRNVADDDERGGRAALDRALSVAVERGELIVDDFLELPQPQWFTYRSPSQPEVRRRTLGARSIEEVPPRELARILADAAETTGWGDRRGLMQTAASELGQAQLTDRAISMFALVLSSARTAPAG